MANEQGGGPGPDETPTRPVPAPQTNAEADASPATQGLPRLGSSLPGDTAPTIPLVPARPPIARVGPLSPQERGVAPPPGLSSMTRGVRITLIALGVLLLVACCTLSWGAVSAIFPPPGGPVAAASTASSGSPTSSASAATSSATDQTTATPGDDATPTSVGGDASPTPGGSPTDTPTATPPAATATATATPCPDPYCNPWGYNFTQPGSVIYSPNPQFCSTFPCIGAPSYSTFWSGIGYVVQCQDGLFTKDGTNHINSQMCRGDGGYSQTLYQHP